MVLRLGLVHLAPLTAGGAATYALAINQALESGRTGLVQTSVDDDSASIPQPKCAALSA